MGLVVDSINKSFGQLHVIKDLSMEVREGFWGHSRPRQRGQSPFALPHL